MVEKNHRTKEENKRFETKKGSHKNEATATRQQRQKISKGTQKDGLLLQARGSKDKSDQ